MTFKAANWEEIPHPWSSIVGEIRGAYQDNWSRVYGCHITFLEGLDDFGEDRTWLICQVLSDDAKCFSKVASTLDACLLTRFFLINLQQTPGFSSGMLKPIKE